MANNVITTAKSPVTINQFRSLTSVDKLGNTVVVSGFNKAVSSTNIDAYGTRLDTRFDDPTYYG